MGMNAPGGGGNASSDKVIIQTALQSDKAASEQAGAQSAKSWLDGFRKTIGNAPMPGGAQAPGRGAASGSIYGQQAGRPGAAPDYRNSGTRGAPPAGPTAGGSGPPTPGAPAPAGEEDDGKVYSRSPQDIRRFRVRRSTATEEERQQALADKEDADAAKAARRDDTVRQREQRRQAAQQRRSGNEDWALLQAEDYQRRRTETARGRRESTQQRDARRAGNEDWALLQAEERQRTRTERAAQRRAREAELAPQRARQELERDFRDMRAAGELEQQREQARQAADPNSQQNIAARQAEARRFRDQQRVEAVNTRRAEIQAQERQVFGQSTEERQAAQSQGLPPDLQARQARLDAATATGIGGFFQRRNLAATDAMQGGLGPVPRAISYGLSAAGNALLLGMPLLSVIQGGGLGDINIPTPFGNIQGPQGDIQTTRRLNAQANAERLRMANISYGRSLYSAQVETQALGIARTREGIQYGYQQADITRSGTRETADYARDTVKLQREALVHQRDYARLSEDIERKRIITERDYSRQVEDTGRQRFVADRNYSRQVEDTARQRTVEERNYQRQYQDFTRSRIVEDRSYQRQYQDFARQRRDDEIQFSRQRQDLNRQAIADTVAFARQQQDIGIDRRNLGISYGRQQQDTAIASGRGNEDYQRERGRAQVAIQDTIKLREIQGRTNLRDLRLREQDIGASQFQSVGSLLGAAQSGDPFAIVSAAYRMRQLRQEKAIVQGDIGRGGFTEAERYQQGVQSKQAGYGLQDIDREHARQQQDIAIQQKRNSEDYMRGLQEINKQEQRMNEDRQRQLETTEIQSKRTDQDEALRKQDLDVQQKRADEDHATNIQNIDIQQKRADEDHATNIQNLDIQQKRFFEDYQTNLQQISIQQTRSFQDYAENVRQIALQQMRQAQDRITQMQQDALAQTQLDVAHARSVEDLGIQQQRADIAHAQSLEDFEIREKAILVSTTQAYEDLENARIAVDREGEAQVIALNKEMRSLWSQLALSVGLFGIFSGQFFQAAKYMAAFAGLIGAPAGAAATAAAATPTAGQAVSGLGGIAQGVGSSGLAAWLAGIGLSPVALKSFDEYMKSINPNYASPFGNITGATTVEAAELPTSPNPTGAGGLQGDFSYQPPSSATTAVEARDDWRTEKRRTGGYSPGGYSPMATGQGTVEQNPTAAGAALGGQTGQIKSNFDASAGLVEKIKKNYEGMDGTAEDIQKRFGEAYGSAEQIKASMAAAATYNPTIVDSSTTMANAAGSAASSMTQGAAAMQQGAASMQKAATDYNASMNAAREQNQKSYGNPSGGLFPDLGKDYTFGRKGWHYVGGQLVYGFLDMVEPQVIDNKKQPTQAERDAAQGLMPYGWKPGDATPTTQQYTPTTPDAAVKQHINAHAIKFGYKSSFYSHDGSPQSFVSDGTATGAKTNGPATSKDISSLTNALSDLTKTIKTGGASNVKGAAVSNRVAQVMTDWVKGTA